MSKNLTREEAEKYGVIEKIPDEENMYYLNGLPTEINVKDKISVVAGRMAKIEHLKKMLNDLICPDGVESQELECFNAYRTGWNDAIETILESFNEPE